LLLLKLFAELILFLVTFPTFFGMLLSTSLLIAFSIVFIIFKR